MIKISKRLETIANLVPINSNIIDVGCDHGLLDIYLYQNKICKRIIASDINKNALNNAQVNINKYKLNKCIETRLGNGLDPILIEDDIDTIIISGIGAHTIMDILKSNLDKLKKIDTIIIQSNTKIEFLRKNITKLNYYILDEELVEDNAKIYTVIKFQKGWQKYNKKELYFGPVLLKKNGKLFAKLNNRELNKLKLILKKLPFYKLKSRYNIKKRIQLYK